MKDKTDEENDDLKQQRDTLVEKLEVFTNEYDY